MASTRIRLRGTRGRAPLRAPSRRPAGRRRHDRSWWQDGVLYQVYPRSFADADGDGHGDLRGLRARLGHLARLGVSGLWTCPTCPSADADWGYDVTGYCDVHPDFGTLEDMDALLADAHAAGIRVLLDLVPNHTSDRHPWFQESRASRAQPEGRLVRLGRPAARRLAAQQLGVDVRRPGVGVRAPPRPVLPAQLHPQPARPQLVVRGRPRRVRPRSCASGSTAASTASASTSARRSSRTARCATTRRRRRRTARTCACAARGPRTR